MLHRFLITLVLLPPAVLAGGSSQLCKVYPDDPSWPSNSAWQNLNDTVFGRLTTPTALAAACRPNSPTFSNLTCYAVNAQWHNTSWVAQNPYMADYNDVSCPLNPILPCSTAGYPAYVIEAIDEKDVQASVNFARDHNIRLVIKGTGHDWPGRSSGPGSLSVWTHNIRGIKVNKDDPYALKYGGTASVTVAAGMRWGEVYAEAAKHNLTIVGGAEPNVGVGGWTLNGGHSPVSSTFGMGADQVLSLEIVTADGQFLTVNETAYPDLFWALRGGGGSTFAIMVSMTIKAYPQLSMTMHSYALVTTANSDTFWSLVAYFHTQIPRISDAGGAGYHYAVPGASLGDPSLTDSYVLAGLWMFANKTEEHVNKTMSPLYAEIANAAWAVDPVYPQANNTFVPDVMTYWANNPSEEGGSSGRLGSWLVDRQGLSNFTELKQQLKKAAPTPPWILISHVVAGSGVRDAARNVPGGSNAVLPAWRRAYTHIGECPLPRSTQSPHDLPLINLSSNVPHLAGRQPHAQNPSDQGTSRVRHARLETARS